MPLKVAMPIVKRPIDGYSEFYDRDQGGNPVLQMLSFRAGRYPRLVAMPEGAERLELHLSFPPLNTDKPWPGNLYAMFPGLLIYRSTLHAGSRTSSLELNFGSLPPNLDLNRERVATILGALKDHDTLGWLYRFNRSCLQLKAITYEGVDDGKIRSALRRLLDSAGTWNEYRLFLRSLPNNVEIQKVTFDEQNREHVTAPPVNIIQMASGPNPGAAREKLSAALESFINDIDSDITSPVKEFHMPVDAGTWIGDAMENVAIGFKDRTHGALNPIYFFRLLLKWWNYEHEVKRRATTQTERLIQFVDESGPNAQYGIESILSVSPDHVLTHPLLWLLKNPGGDSTDYLAELALPVGKGYPKSWQLFVPPPETLTEMGHDLTEYSRADGVPQDAKLEWRVDDSGYLVYRMRDNARTYPWDEEAYYLFNLSNLDQVKWIWDRSATTLNAGTGTYRLPLEVLVAIGAKESAGQTRICGFEPWPGRYDYREGADPSATRTKYAKMTYLKVDVNGRVITMTLRDKPPVQETLSADDVSDIQHLRDALRGMMRRFHFTDKHVESPVFNQFAEAVKPIIDNGSTSTFWYSSIPETRLGGVSVPNQTPGLWKPAQIPHNGVNYTWQDMLNDLSRTNNGTDDVAGNTSLAKRISPGIAQTLLTVANSAIKSFGDPSLPAANDFDAIFEWLLLPENSLRAAMWTLNFHLHRSDMPTGYDPVKQRIAYGAGGLYLSGGAEFGYRGSDHITNGLPNSNAWAQAYNATVAHFNRNVGTADFPQPAVRLNSV